MQDLNQLHTAIFRQPSQKINHCEKRANIFGLGSKTMVALQDGFKNTWNDVLFNTTLVLDPNRQFAATNEGKTQPKENVDSR